MINIVHVNPYVLRYKYNKNLVISILFAYELGGRKINGFQE